MMIIIGIIDHLLLSMIDSCFNKLGLSFHFFK